MAYYPLSAYTAAQVVHIALWPMAKVFQTESHLIC